MTLVPNSSCFGNPILYLSGSSIKQISSEANGKVVGKTRLEKKHRENAFCMGNIYIRSYGGQMF